MLTIPDVHIVCFNLPAGGQRNESLSPEWVLKGIAEHAAKEFSTIFGYDEAILDSGPEFPVDVYSRFIAEGHPGLQGKGIVLHQVWPFVSLQPDTVSQAVDEVFVPGTVTGVFDHFPCDPVQFTCPDSREYGFMCRSLGIFNYFKDSLLFIGRTPADDGAGYVGTVTFDRASPVNQDGISVFEFILVA
jgi:hypothetical protein